MSSVGVLVFLRELKRSSRNSALCLSSFQLLLIFDIEFALLMSTAASTALEACGLLARGRAGSPASCRILPTVERRGGRSRRPFRALSMGRCQRVMTLLRDCHVGSSLFCSVVGVKGTHGGHHAKDVRSASGRMTSESLAASCMGSELGSLIPLQQNGDIKGPLIA